MILLVILCVCASQRVTLIRCSSIKGQKKSFRDSFFAKEIKSVFVLQSSQVTINKALEGLIRLMEESWEGLTQLGFSE